MARSFNGTTQNLIKTGALFAGPPGTMACWLNMASVAADRVAMAIGNTDITDTQFDMVFYTSDKHFRAENIDDGNVDDDTAVSTVTIAAGTPPAGWHHVACVYATTTSRICYVDGGTPGSSTTDLHQFSFPAGASVIGCGCYHNLFSPFFSGNIAFPAFWSDALTAPEVASLAARISPQKIRPQSLVAYCRLTGDTSPDVDMVSSTGWTLTAAPTDAVNPAVYMG